MLESMIQPRPVQREEPLQKLCRVMVVVYQRFY